MTRLLDRLLDRILTALTCRLLRLSPVDPKRKPEPDLTNIVHRSKP